MRMIERAVDVHDHGTLRIGVRGEDKTNRVVFNVTKLIETYGEGEAVLLVKRSADENPYISTGLSREGNNVIWTVSSVDTAYSGYGECELCWYVRDDLAKSKVYSTVVFEDILGSEDTSIVAPDPYEVWIETLGGITAELAHGIREVEDWVDKAEQIAVANGYVDLWVDDDGALFMARTSNIVDKLSFELTENGELEAIISG